MTPPTSLELMQYADDELSSERRAEVDAWLAAGGGADAGREAIEAIAQVGEFVRSHAEVTTCEFDVTETVMARIDAPNVTSIAGARTAGGAGRGPERRSPRAAILGFVSLGFAAAAAMVLWLSGSERGGEVASPGAALPTGISLSRDDTAVSDPEEAEGASILSVDFGAQNGSIFMVHAGADVTPVVWLLDETEPSGDRMEPL